MLNLKLRDEFLGPHMPGTAISLRKSDHTGAAQQDPRLSRSCKGFHLLFEPHGRSHILRRIMIPDGRCGLDRDRF